MQRSAHRLILGVLLTVLCLALVVPAAWANGDPDVTVTYGPTPIVNGSCLGANDITVENGYFAVSFAVDSTPPWGVPNGSILDGATYDAYGVLNDRLTLVDFLPNGWAAWPNTYQTVTVPVDTVDMAVVQVERDYNELELVTTFTVTKGSRFVDVETVATNPIASGTTFTDIYCGYTFCTSGGYMFGPFAEDGSTVSDPYGKYVLGYDKDYSIGLHFPAADVYDGGTGWKDLYQTSTIAPGEAMTYEAAIQFEDSASISRFVKTVSDERADPTGTVSGEVTPAADSFPEPPIVIVERDGETFTWVVAEGGLYSLELPAGDYEFYAVAKDYSPTDKVAVTVGEDDVLTQDFAGLEAMSTLTVKVKKEGTTTRVDGRIEVTGGIAPVVGFLGKSVFFTDLDDVGIAQFNVAAGDITLNVTSGDKFISQVAVRDVTIEEGVDRTVSVAVKTLFVPSRGRWFSADLHHHSNILDGVTPPRDLVQSQLAGRLDFTLVSDHDSVANNLEVRALSRTRGVPFISANEVSPIWAHFVTYQVSLTAPVLVDPAGTAQEIIDEAHAAGMTITLAHPYIAYGYFTADEADTIPGGYSDDFDLIELQSTRVTTKTGTSADERTLAKAYDLWTGKLTNQNKKHYLTGGDDVHDVWAHTSGSTRTYAKIPLDQRVNQKNYVAALKAGRAYVTTGPLMRPYYFNFGTTKTVKNSSPRITFDLRGQAAYGLEKIEVVRNGTVIRSLTFGDETYNERVVFSIRNLEKSWYCFIVEDVNGDRAISNPVWTRMAD